MVAYFFSYAILAHYKKLGVVLYRRGGGTDYCMGFTL